jgi:hypothetical protein
VADTSIDLEGIRLAGTVAIDGAPNSGDRLTQLRVVMIRDQRTRRPSLRLADHESEASRFTFHAERGRSCVATAVGLPVRKGVWSPWRGRSVGPTRS